MNTITLENIHEATLKEIFEQGRDHLLKQGQRSILVKQRYEDGGTSEICMYFSPEGLKCAIGCFIADNKYSDQIEQTPLCSVLVFYRIELDVQRTELLDRLRHIHDNAPVEKWETKLNKVGDSIQTSALT